MEFLKKHRRILMAIIIFAVALFIYLTFFRDEDKDSGLVSTTVATVETGVEIDLISLLFELSNVDLDGALFEKRSFQSLVDFGQEILPQPIGRPNPFAPVGSDVGDRQGDGLPAAGGGFLF
jgi:hypothetical protein